MHASPDSNEYGANEKLNSLIVGDYKALTVTTNGLNNGWLPNFTWNSTNSYSTGFSHIHTDGTAPSPQDAFDLLKNLSKPDLLNASTYEKEFYKKNASFTTITSTGETYVVTVADWDLLKSIYENRYLSNPQSFDASYNTLADKYKDDHNSTEAVATEYAFKGKLGNSVNLFKKNTSTGKFEPIKPGEQIGNVTGPMLKIPCP